MGARTTQRAGVFGCLLAVCMWAFKPTLIALTPSSVGFAEVYLISGAIAAVAGLPFILYWLLKASKTFSRSVIFNIALAGMALGVWYYGFYRALKEAPVVEASVIGFSWVLIAAILMPILGPKTMTRMSQVQWGLMLVAFMGVTLVTLSGAGAGTGNPRELIWAGIAAIGSGLYLPFAVKATRSIGETLPSGTASILTITGANVVSVSTVGLVLMVSNAPLDFSGVGMQTWVVCAIIGLGVYMAAEICWTWGYSQANSQAVGVLSYAVPALSTILLYIFFGAEVTWLTLVGMALIIGANVLMQKVAPKTQPQS